jgi:hypothetical protein
MNMSEALTSSGIAIGNVRIKNAATILKSILVIIFDYII